MGMIMPLKRVNPAPLAGGNRAEYSSKLDKPDNISSDSADQPPRLIFARVPQAAIFNPAVSPAALRVLAALCTYIDLEGICWPSVGTLSDRLGDGYSPRMVQRHLRALEAAGHITIEIQPNGVGKSSNIYRVRFDSTALVNDGRVSQDDTPTPDTACHPGGSQDDTPRVSQDDTLTTPLNQTQLTRPSGTIPGLTHETLSEASRTVTRDSKPASRKHPSSHLVDRCTKYGGTAALAWEFAASLAPAELATLAYDNSNTPMRAYRAFLARQPGSGQSALHSRGVR